MYNDTDINNIFCVYVGNLLAFFFSSNTQIPVRRIIKNKISTYLIDTKIMANIKYFPSSGTTNDVGGIISTTSRKNTWRLIRIDIDSVTYKKIENVNLTKYTKEEEEV